MPILRINRNPHLILKPSHNSKNLGIAFSESEALDNHFVGFGLLHNARTLLKISLTIARSASKVNHVYLLTRGVGRASVFNQD